MNSKEKILEELRRSRLAIARDIHAVADEVNIAAKLKRSVITRPLAWLGSAAVLGYILAGPKSRRAAVVKGKKGAAAPLPPFAPRGGWAIFFSSLVTVFKLLLPVLRPALSAYAAQRLGEFAAKSSR